MKYTLTFLLFLDDYNYSTHVLANVGCRRGWVKTHWSRVESPYTHSWEGSHTLLSPCTNNSVAAYVGSGSHAIGRQDILWQLTVELDNPLTRLSYHQWPTPCVECWHNTSFPNRVKLIQWPYFLQSITHKSTYNVNEQYDSAYISRSCKWLSYWFQV